MSGAREEEQFEIALEDATREQYNDRRSKEPSRPSKRQKKDARFGFGGTKRFSKSGDATSSADMSGFSARKMKGGWQKQKRPGKSKRARIS